MCTGCIYLKAVDSLYLRTIIASPTLCTLPALRPGAIFRHSSGDIVYPASLLFRAVTVRTYCQHACTIKTALQRLLQQRYEQWSAQCKGWLQQDWQC
jgi:hypothetical protein